MYCADCSRPTSILALDHLHPTQPLLRQLFLTKQYIQPNAISRLSTSYESGRFTIIHPPRLALPFPGSPSALVILHPLSHTHPSHRYLQSLQHIHHLPSAQESFYSSNTIVLRPHSILDQHRGIPTLKLPRSLQHTHHLPTIYESLLLEGHDRTTTALNSRAASRHLPLYHHGLWRRIHHLPTTRRVLPSPATRSYYDRTISRTSTETEASLPLLYQIT